MRCTETAEPIELMFTLWTPVGRWKQTLIVFSRWRQCAHMVGTLAPPGEYDWTVRPRPRCGLLSSYFDQLLFINFGSAVHVTKEMSSDVRWIVTFMQMIPTQLFFFFRLKHHAPTKCSLVDLFAWMTASLLTLNSSKTYAAELTAITLAIQWVLSNESYNNKDNTRTHQEMR